MPATPYDDTSMFNLDASVPPKALRLNCSEGNQGKGNKGNRRKQGSVCQY